MPVQYAQKLLTGSIIVNGSLEAVWEAWTTPHGIRTFFAPDCRIDLRVDGAYEMLFNLDAPQGQQGGEGMRILAIQSKHMLSFMWNAPPELAEVRGQRTHVMVEFEPITPTQTKVILTQDGWGVGGEWDQAYEYFSEAWYKIVLPRLKASFEGNPVKWE
jgi:uncharacterized protein YndB with AHSA1/START domain